MNVDYVLIKHLCMTRRMPRTAFAAVTTQWTGADTLKQLRTLPNVTILAANPDVDVIFRQTKVLLAPSLWQVTVTVIPPPWQPARTGPSPPSSRVHSPSRD